MDAKTLIEKYPYDRSDHVITYTCGYCEGHEIEVSRDLVRNADLMDMWRLRDHIDNTVCANCGRKMDRLKRADGNYEKRIRADQEYMQKLRESWEPIPPRELLDLVNKTQDEEVD